VARLHNVVMAVEMHAVAGARALDPGDHVPAGIPVAVGGRAMGADQFHGKAPVREARTEKLADFAVVQARGIERGDAHESLRQGDDLVASGLDGRCQCMVLVHVRHTARRLSYGQALPFRSKVPYT
jgi:hypothetical protein